MSIIGHTHFRGGHSLLAAGHNLNSSGHTPVTPHSANSHTSVRELLSVHLVKIHRCSSHLGDIKAKYTCIAGYAKRMTFCSLWGLRGTGRGRGFLDNSMACMPSGSEGRRRPIARQDARATCRITAHRAPQPLLQLSPLVVCSDPTPMRMAATSSVVEGETPSTHPYFQWSYPMNGDSDKNRRAIDELINTWNALWSARNAAVVYSEITAGGQQIKAYQHLTRELMQLAMDIIANPSGLLAIEDTGVLPDFASFLANFIDGQTAEDWLASSENLMYRRRALYTALHDAVWNGDMEAAKNFTWVALPAPLSDHPDPTTVVHEQPAKADVTVYEPRRKLGCTGHDEVDAEIAELLALERGDRKVRKRVAERTNAKRRQWSKPS